MKKIFLIIVLLTSTIFGLNWSKNLKTAFTTAKEHNKTVMIFVEGEYCRWCKKLEHRILTSDEIEKRLKNYVLVKLDREDDEMEKLPEVQGVPTVFFMTPKKKVLEEIIGYLEVKDFASYIDDVEKKVKKSK